MLRCLFFGLPISELAVAVELPDKTRIKRFSADYYCMIWIVGADLSVCPQSGLPL